MTLRSISRALVRRSSAPRSEDGFTLLEVLAALLIFSMTAVVLGSAYLNVLTSYAIVGAGRGYERELAYARNAVLTQPTLATVQAGDEYDSTDSIGSPLHVKWSADVEPANIANLFTVTMTTVITRSDTGAAKTYNQVFSLLRPTWSDPTDQGTLKQNDIQRILKYQGKTQ